MNVHRPPKRATKSGHFSRNAFSPSFALYEAAQSTLFPHYHEGGRALEIMKSKRTLPGSVARYEWWPLSLYIQETGNRKGESYEEDVYKKDVFCDAESRKCVSLGYYPSMSTILLGRETLHYVKVYSNVRGLNTTFAFARITLCLCGRS